ncbi:MULTISPECIES: 2Fe-2S iron-sulfur cluster-binding protein [Vibrio]|jgi:predicted molibdopterin-dependent oxidoreductase YjgC|uniref:2Fe-2S iron-sulfur cluster-binding protein n=1 Tax=Vibrio TaxID=662 RepID=UPI0005AF1ADE|nr:MULTISPECIES: (2Fe-2S)-binding protein [Vibrio]KIP75018.1 (2Fe-2S)-binding protein [Vibrio harveyi]KIP76159.1 (2Fe-2S)-binding protein [Vibrio harveyi]MCX2791267.1 (2Fe-2S)-binding protein [Vibrio sp. Sgm 5]NOJ17535.1 (2Fe-2S)-binding protein [Vibrio jasicida]PMO40135.1 (2Fe-2S)-binding protein [Vibrio sp. 10N.222.52.B12]
MFTFKPAIIEIDNHQIAISPDDQNLVETARKVKVNIAAPCLKNKRKHGCCHACKVEVNGTPLYACKVKPQSGMKVIVRRADLDEERKQAIKTYKQQIKKGETKPCQCG